MLSKRVLIVAGDKPLQKRLIAGSMAAGGAVQAFSAADELSGRLDADLLIYALAQPNDTGFLSLLARLPDGARLVPILPAPNLEQMVALLNDGRITTVLSAAEMGTPAIAAVVSKLLYGDLFGLEKVMPWGVRVYSSLVGDYNEKSMAIASVADFAQAMGVRRKYREQIDQCIDEMLMNALYDAPIDGDGKPLFAEVPVRERVLLKSNEKAVLQYACDGDRFAVSVRDNFGSLKKSTVLAYLDKCLHATGAEQIDRKAGGAGLGLYLIANAATEIHFHIFEGSATEVVCSFDLAAPRSQLRMLGVFEESIATAARPSTGNTRTVLSRRGRRVEDLSPPPRSSPLLPAMMGFSVLLLLGAVALAAMPYLRPPPSAALRIECDPPGATVFIDGRNRGAAPLRIAGLEAGRSYSVRATASGHKDDDQLVSAAAGESTVRLKLPELRGRVIVESDPPGAKLILDGKDSGKLTPAELDLAQGRTAEVRLEKDGFSDQRLTITGPQAGQSSVYRGSLPLSPLIAALTVESNPVNANVTVDGLALLPVAPSHDTFVRPGIKHLVRVSAPGFIELKEELLLSGGEHKTVHAQLVEGGVLQLKCNLVARVLVDGRALAVTTQGGSASLALAEGKHTLALVGQKPFLRYQTSVVLEKGRTIDKSLSFGTIEVKAPGVSAHPDGADPKGVTELALPAGAQKLTLSNKDGERRERDLMVEPGAKLVIDSW